MRDRKISDIIFSLIHLEKGATEPLEGITNNLINKIAGFFNKWCKEKSI